MNDVFRDELHIPWKSFLDFYVHYGMGCLVGAMHQYITLITHVNTHAITRPIMAY